MKKIILITIALLFIPAVCFGSEPVPHKDFVKFTEAALDALDQLESAAQDGPRFEVEKMSRKLGAALKKYDRYVKSWPEGSRQAAIVTEISRAKAGFDYLTLQYSRDTLDKSRQAAQKARELFTKYQSKP